MNEKGRAGEMPVLPDFTLIISLIPTSYGHSAGHLGLNKGVVNADFAAFCYKP
jgi:hypothetical protein